MTTIQSYAFATCVTSPNMDLRLYHCGTESYAPGHAYGPGMRDYYKIYDIHSGKGVFRANGQTYDLDRGQDALNLP